MKEKEWDETRKLNKLLANKPMTKQCTIRRIMKGETSGWLTMLLQQADWYDRTNTQFRDQLATDTTMNQLSGLPTACDGCGKPFSLQLGLDCAKGGLVK